MDDLKRGFASAMARVELAERELAVEPASQHWHRVWRDALDLAVKWQREIRRESTDTDSFEDELERVLAS